ncbi:hypothetical protein JCM3770_005564 [Rhodotorula araucariae]
MNFNELLERAKANTARAQAEHARLEQERAAAKKAAEAAEARKQAEARRILEERRREREERERKDREAAERKKAQAQQLPKTTNLWALKQERKKRGLDPDGKEDHLIPGISASSKASSSSKAGSSGRSNGSASKGKAKEESGGLTREERARRKQAALFLDDEPSTGSFALARTQQVRSGSARPSPSAQDSPRASPALAKPSSARTSAAGGGALILKPKAGTKPFSSLSRSSASTSAAAPPSAGSARDRLKASLAKTGPLKLNTVKRDTRTIEEIERDMRARKGGGVAAPDANGKGKESARSAGAARPQNGAASSSGSKPARRRPSSPSESDSDSDDDDERYRKRRRAAGGSSSGLNEKQRSAIWELMGRNRERDVQRDYASDDSSDMEATGTDVLAEERRAARLAAKEDAEEQERLRLHAERKKARKAGLA